MSDDLREQIRAEWEAMPVHYPFPLIHGMATLVLPKKLSYDDAERLVTFIQSLPERDK